MGRRGRGATAAPLRWYHRGMTILRTSLFVTACLVIVGCDGQGPAAGTGGAGGAATTSATPTFQYDRDGELRLNQLQTKGTHNSYHVAPEGDVISALDYTHAPLDVQLAEQGVRQIELDVRFDEGEGHFSVYHEIFDKGTTCATLVECLSAVKGWSDKNPAHHPIFIQVELKDKFYPDTAQAYFETLEGDALSVFPRERIVTPDDVRGGAASVRDALAESGWPTLGEVRGKVVFFIDTSGDARAYYTFDGKGLEGRLMFIDAEPTDPWAGVLLANDAVGSAAKIAESLAAGLIVRTRADADNVEPLAGDTSTREAALSSGAQLVSTDYPAEVDGVDYVVQIPGGTPSRCNPVTAPADCAPEDIEDPKWIQP